jgi:predicted ATP-grasp superfamily ATP-dependent carboligase
MSYLSLYKSPRLKDPAIIIGLAGWPDAGGVSSLSLSYINEVMNSSRLGVIELTDYIDLTYHRPIVEIENGFVKSITMPSFDVNYAISSSRDLILVSGYEPRSGWDKFISALFELIEKFKATHIVTIGGLLDRIPHTRPVRVSFLSGNERMYNKAINLGLRPSNYTGPGSIHSLIISKTAELGIDSASIWGHVPNYINFPNPRVISVVLEKLCKLIDVTIDLDRLYFEASSFDGKLNSLMEQDEEMRKLVEALEKEFDREERVPDYIK